MASNQSLCVAHRPDVQTSAVRFIKSDLLDSLSDDVINQTCQQFHSVPDGCSKSVPVIQCAWLT